MRNRVIIGGQWGDEGKGKIVDALSRDVDWVLRYQGGANAGHTIHIGADKHVLHLIPSGALHDGVRCLLGGGMVVDPWALRDEMIGLEARGFRVRERIFVAAGASLLMPHHMRMDELREAKLGRHGIGTTGRGIGPAYLDKVQRTGLRMGDLLLPAERLERKVIEKVLAANEILGSTYQAEPLPARVLAEELVVLAQTLAPLVVDAHRALSGVRAGRETALFEGAQGTMLDVDHGTYPYVTSSNTTVGGALTGTGLPPSTLGDVHGIFKAYCTRVGNGPFPTELLGEPGDRLREAGGEFGATTGRARRCGWFDAVAGRYAADINGMTGAIITKLDVLDTAEVVPVATAYELDGQSVDLYPTGGEVLPRCRPVYREFPGWRQPLGECRAPADLPPAALRYLEFLQQVLDVPIVGVSVGRDRTQMIWTPGGIGL